jgi:mannose-6-phosphate isomerase-like protein (cupin superfamily)
MAHITRERARVFEQPGLTVTGLASPTRGASENTVWRLSLAPGTEGAVHRVDREEIFVALTGTAQLRLGDELFELRAGEAFIVPKLSWFSLTNQGSRAFEAVAVLPVGGRAALLQGEPFTPPWAE